MPSRLRVAGLAACCAISLLLASATPATRTGRGPDASADGVDADNGSAAGPVVNTASTTPPPPVTDPPVGALAATAAISELRAADEAPLVEFDDSGHVVGVLAPPGGSLSNPGGNGADGFVRRYSAAFGLSHAYTAVRGRSARLPGGDTVVRYLQVAGGLPVIGGEIVVTADVRGRVRGVAAEATPSIPTTTAAAVSEADAGRVAKAAASERFSLDATQLRVGQASLWIYDPRLIGAPGTRGARPTWWIDVVGVNGDGAATVLVDATDATVALALTAKREAQPDRIVCDLNGIENTREFDLNDVNVYGCNDYSALGRQTTTRREGGPASSVADVNKAFDYLGVTQGFYQTNFGIDSYDGRGGQLRATVRACQKDIVIPPFTFDFRCPYPNAFWDGYQFVFGAGFPVDDVTAHEYTHAVIDHASQLFYAYQSGAINEGFADIFGEFVDQSFAGPGEDTTKLWLIGEDLPFDPFLTPPRRELRDMADPMRLGQPAMFFGANYYGGDDDNGGVHQNSGVANHLAYLIAQGGTDQFETFPGIGLARSKVLWYRAIHLMPSGGDYPMLGRVLEQACVELVGHSGFVADNCFNTLRHARSATSGNYAPPQFGCFGGSTADPAVFHDDIEQPGKWTLTPNWSILPTPGVPVSYASSGKGSLYGYSPPGGLTGFATTKDAFTVPTNATFEGPFLSYRLLTPSLGRSQTTTGPLWQYDDVSDPAGWQNIGSASFVQGGEFSDQTLGLANLRGKTVRLRVRVAPGEPEWLVDDVNVNSCTYTYFARATDVSAVWTGTTAVVGWKYSSMPQDHFELSYDPPIPGAPTFLPGLGINQSDVPRSVTLTGLDPAETYSVTITLFGSPSDNAPRPVTFQLKAEPTSLCLTQPPLPFRNPWTPPKSFGPSGECAPTPATPRRTG